MVDRRNALGFISPMLLYLVLFDCVIGQTRAELLTRFSERFTLLSLRSSLGLKSKDWPIKEDPCVVWRGIQCDNGSVIGINISGFKRTRIGKQYPKFAVDPLRNLTNLAYFNASGFALPGIIPDWFGVRLLRLQVLDLSSCSVKGVLPVTFGDLSGLRTLNVSGNSLTGSVPSSLGKLLNLLELDLSSNSLPGSLPSSLNSLRNLLTLDVSSNQFTGPIPSGIGRLSRLLYLNLSNNSFSSSIPSQLGDLRNLVELDLSLNALSGSVPQELRKLKKLQKLMIGDNLLSGSLPSDLFGAESKLQSLVLKENNFSGKLPDVCWSLPKLQILDISRNNFTGILPKSTFDPKQKVALVNISSNTFYGGLTQILRRFKAMDLSGNYFEGKVPDYVLRANVLITDNCLQNEKRQKSLKDCSSFYKAKGLVFDDFRRSRAVIDHKTLILLAVVAGAIGFILLFVVLPILVVLCKRRRDKMIGSRNGVKASSVVETTQAPGGGRTFDFLQLGDTFTYEQLLQATEEFNDANLIKHGHSGHIFRGVLENGIPIIIKRIDIREVKSDGYISELEFFSEVGHQRVVPLIGHCLENENQKFLVYKYMRNRDLATSLFKKSENGNDELKSLDWITRLKIALGVAEGLSYLHHECSPPIVHRDIQASSILLDDKFEVRLGSLSETYVQGDAHQNRLSRLLRIPTSNEPSSSSGAANATCAYDVYGFGKVLLELVTGKLGISSPNNPQGKEYLEEVLPYINTNEKELVNKIIDPSLLVDEDLLEEVWAMAIIAKSCLNPKSTKRPQMRHILNALENPVKVVRKDSSGSSSLRLRTNSSRGSWNAAIFGNWNQTATDANKVEGETSGFGVKNLRSLGNSGRNNDNTGNLSSRRRQLSEIVPEFCEIEDV